MIGIDAVRQIANETLAAKGRAAIEFGEDGCVDLEFSGIPITLMYSAEPVEMVWLFADVGRVRDDPAVLEGILRYGLKLWLSGEMTIALDHDGEHLVGYSSAPASALTPHVLEAQLDRLVGAAADMVDRLAHNDFEFDLSTAEAASRTPPTDWLTGRV